MEGPGGAQYDGIRSTVRKKRSQACRRPRPDSHVGVPAKQGPSLPLSSTSSDDFSKISSDNIPAFDTNPRRKEFSLSQCMSRAASLAESVRGNFGSRQREIGKNTRLTEGVLAPANWKNLNSVKEGLELECNGNNVFSGGNGGSLALGDLEGKVKKVKFKVGGFTRTIHSNGSLKQNVQGNSDDCNSPRDKKVDLQGIPWKDFSFGNDGATMGTPAGKKQGEPAGPVRKSKRVPKRRVLDGEFSEDVDNDDEIRYLEKLKFQAVSLCKEGNEELGKRQHKPSGVSDGEITGKRKSRSNKVSEDIDYEEEEDDLVSDNENEGGMNIRKKKQQKKELAESSTENRRELTLTTRQRGLAASGANGIEFPDGLPPAPPRKRKETLSAVEQQLKKAEAAQRRKIQNEKAARETEAEAIRKILGQDSNRKKREEKMKKRLEELALEKAAHEEMAASSCIRTIMSPNGTTMTFPRDMGFPSLFETKLQRYPPPRERCAGPSCTNPYKYRHSKTNLPLCSLQCYKAVEERVQPETTS